MDIQANIDVIEDTDFELFTRFTLHESLWIENYYAPLEKQIKLLK